MTKLTALIPLRLLALSGRRVLVLLGCLSALSWMGLPLLVHAQEATSSAQMAQNDTLQEVVVTAQQVRQPLVDVPVAVSVLAGTQLRAEDIHSFQGYAEQIPNLSFDYGAVGIAGYVNTLEVAIRGIQGANTTGFYIDDVEIPNSIDPQIIDVKRIEVLKGPQGTLYGAGSMGGDVRIITNQPTFKNEYSYTVSAGLTAHSPTPDYRVSSIGNLSLIPGVAAIRAVGFVDHQGGWLTRTYSDRLPTIYPTTNSSPVHSVGNQGATRTYGGTVTLLIKPTENFSATLRLLAQHDYGFGRAAQYAPLPTFEPTGYIVPREANFQETDAQTWSMPSLVLHYDTKRWNITSSTGYLSRHLHQSEDGTEGDQDLIYEITGIVLPAPSAIPQNHWLLRTSEYWFDEEVHANVKQIGFFRAALGAQYTDQKLNNTFEPTYLPGLASTGLYPNNLLWASHASSDVSQVAFFGQTYWDFWKFEVTLGARWYRVSNTTGSRYSDGWYSGGFVSHPKATATETGVVPKIALSYKITRNSMVYASAAEGFRPGGTNNTLPAICDPGLKQLGLTASGAQTYHSDSIWDYEVGGKAQLGRLLLTGAAFEMKWTGMQQTQLIPICFQGLTANVGSARIRGAEFEMQGSPIAGVQMRIGVGYEDPRLLSAGAGGFTAGSRIPYIPFINGSAALTYTRPINDNMAGFISSDFSYKGSSLSARTPAGLGPQERGGYGIWNARLGVEWGKDRLQVYLKNITSKEANLGDLYLESANQVDTNGNLIPFVVIPPPLQIGVQFSRDF